MVVDPWLRGERFYGREAEIREILEGPRDGLWVLGTRKIGKTSLLRHIELLTERSPEGGDCPLFWDLHGVEDRETLRRSFDDGLAGARARLQRVGVRAGDLEGEDPPAALGRVRRHLRSRGVRLLVLCDGAEALLHLVGSEPALLRKLRRSLRSGEGLRTVLASTLELWNLTEQRVDTSPFLHGFAPPLSLRPFDVEDARRLVLETPLPAEARHPLLDETAAQIAERSGGHPFLLQTLCRRALEGHGVDEAFEEMATDDMLGALFSSDFDMLPDDERTLVVALAQDAPVDAGELESRLALDAGAVKRSLIRLVQIGLVRRDARSRFALASPLFRRWLAGRPKPTSSGAARATRLLVDMSRADRPPIPTADDLFEAVYDPMRRLAGRFLRRERPGHTLQPTALVHEAYLKLIDQSRVDWKGRTHFFAVGARVMRRILIDHARTRRRAKRGGDWLRVTLSGLAAPHLGGELDSAGLLALHSALDKLARVDERQARVVELRYFAGLTASEVANVLGVSKRTVDGDWALARAWLEKELAG